MTGKRAIERDELEIFDLALRQQQPVEGIARFRFGLDGGDHVARFD